MRFYPKDLASESNKKRLPETQLIETLRRGDRKGLEFLYEQYKDALYGVVLRIVKVEVMAEEVLQDVFVNIWQNINRYDAKKGRLFTWMINIARNMAIDKIRSKEMKIWKKNNDLDLEWNQVIQKYSEYLKTDTLGLENLFGHLNSRQQMIMRLVYLEGYSHREIAKEFNVPLGTVKSLVRSGLKAIRKMLLTYQKEEVLLV